jgi:hypothetical protein
MTNLRYNYRKFLEPRRTAGSPTARIATSSVPKIVQPARRSASQPRQPAAPKAKSPSPIQQSSTTSSLPDPVRAVQIEKCEAEDERLKATQDAPEDICHNEAKEAREEEEYEYEYEDEIVLVDCVTRVVPFEEED